MNKKVLVTVILFGSLTVSGIVSAQSVYPGQHQGKLKKGNSRSPSGGKF